MSALNFLRWLRRSGPAAARRGASVRLLLERLEDRLAPALVTVLNNADAGAGSLRGALGKANPGDVIDFAADVRTIGLTSGGLTIATNVTVQNDRGGGPVTIDGGGQFTVFMIDRGVTAVLSGLTISDGRGVAGGGGIRNDGTLTIRNSTFSANSAGGGDLGGGGVYNVGTLTVSDSTFSANSAILGGGIENVGVLTLTDSTFSGNTAGSSGGGVYAGGATTLNGDILVGNTDGDHLADDLGGVGVDPSSGNNLVGADRTGSLTSGQNGNQVGVTVAQAGLAPLADNGGPAETFALPPGSLALGAGVTHAAPAFDQRGVARPVGVPSDVGAFQAVFPPTNVQLSSSVAVTPKGQPVTLTGAFADLRTNEPTTATIAWGDGSADTTLNLAAGVLSFSAAHTYATEGDFFPAVFVANADGRTAAAAPEEQVLPAPFQVVVTLQGQPGQTVSGVVTDPASGDILQTILTLSPGDAGVGEFLAAQYSHVLLTPTTGALRGIASYDFREHDLSPNDSAQVGLIIYGSLEPGAVPELLYLDSRTHQEHVFRGDVHFLRGPNVLIVAIVFNDAGAPRLSDLTTTVFTVAVAVPGATVSAAVSASVVSANAGATASVQTATFQSSSQLRLTLATTQLGQVSQSVASLSDGGGGADTASPDIAAADDGLAKLVVEAVEAVWHDGEPVLRLWRGPQDTDPPATPMAAPDAAPPVPQPPEVSHEKQSQGETVDPHDLGDLLPSGPADPIVRAVDPGPGIPHHHKTGSAVPYLLTAPVIGLGLTAAGRRRRMKRRARS